MPRGSAALTFTIIAVLASLGYAQQVPQTDSVADAARQQKQSNSEEKIPTKKKVYTNADLVPSVATAGKDAQADPQAASPQGEAAAVPPSSMNAGRPTAAKKTRAQDHTDTSRPSIFDLSIRLLSQVLRLRRLLMGTIRVTVIPIKTPLYTWGPR
jgi:hypothetical protein